MIEAKRPKIIPIFFTAERLFYNRRKTMKKLIQGSIILTLLLILIAGAHASAPQWKVDPAHSGIYFSIDHIYSKTQGFFEEYEGDIRFDPNNLKQSSFAFKVKVKSIDTNNSKRDGHLQSDDFFSAKKYPEMRFDSTSIMHVKGNEYVVDGTISIKDVQKKIKLPFTFFGTKTHPFNPKQDVAGFETRMTLDRLEYNVGGGKFYKMGVVGKDVDVLITVEAVKDK